MQAKPKETMNYGLVDSSRVHKVFYPYVGNTLTNTGTRITKIRADTSEKGEFIDGRSSFISFDVAATNSTHNPALLSDVWSIWKSYRTKVNGREIEYRDQVGRQQVLEGRATLNSSYRTSVGKICRLIDDTEANNQNLGTVRCAIPFPRHSFLSKLVKAENHMIEIELELNSNADEISTADSGTTTITVSNIEMHLDYVKNSYLYNSIGEKVNFVDVKYHSWTVADASTSFSQQIPISSKSLRSIVTYMFDTDTYQEQSTYTKMTHTLLNGSTQYQFKIAGKNFPVNPVNCTNGSEPLLHLLRCFDNVEAISQPKYAPSALDGSFDNNTLSTGFALSYDFRGDKNLLSGLDSLGTGSSQTAVLQWVGTANQPTTVYCYIFEDKTYVF